MWNINSLERSRELREELEKESGCQPVLLYDEVCGVQKRSRFYNWEPQVTASTLWLLLLCAITTCNKDRVGSSARDCCWALEFSSHLDLEVLAKLGRLRKCWWKELTEGFCPVPSMQSMVGGSEMLLQVSGLPWLWCKTPFLACKWHLGEVQLYIEDERTAFKEEMCKLEL